MDDNSAVSQAANPLEDFEVLDEDDMAIEETAVTAAVDTYEATQFCCKHYFV